MPRSTNDIRIKDKEEEAGIISAFRSAVKTYNYFFHVVFLECCKFVDATPVGLQIKKNAFIEFDSNEMCVFWNQTIASTERDLLETLIIGIVDKMMGFEITFWEKLCEIEESVKDFDDILDWWVKLVRFLSKEEKKHCQTEKKKLRKLLKHDEDRMEMALERFDDHHLKCFDFKRLKFIPTPRFVDKAALKNDLERFGRKLRLKWFFRNDERDFVPDQFKKKSNRSKNFNPRNQDAAIEMYLSRLEEEILNLNTRIREHNISKEERKAIDSLRNDTSIIIKGADKGSCIVVWDREDYLREAESQLGDESVYEKLSGDASPLIEVVKSCIDSIDKRGDIPRDTLDYFLVENPKIGRFYLLPKIHKRLYRVPGRPVISNSSYYTENISAFLDFHLKPLAKQVKSFVKDTNDFLKKLSSLPNLPSDTILCTADVVGLYPSIPHEDGLESLRRAFDSRDEKTISTSSLLELSKCVLENNIFEHNSEVFKQKQGTAIGTKMAPNYAILFMSDLEEKILDSAPHNLKPLVWWRYIDDIFFLWQHGEESLKLFFDHLNSDETHKSVKFTFEYSNTSINFLDNLGVLLRKLHIMLTGDKDHKKVFRDVPIVGFRRGDLLFYPM
ncbi:uncharacterized protein [Clytia hemisphaerica]|uniref:uncharacterized protein n=1 Tax=Clytia hemisphaerica TaxID=252671 RepID=UPI0034D5679E